MKQIALFEEGDFDCCAPKQKAFSSFEKALKAVSRGFVEKKVPGYDYYAENKKKEQWIRITTLKIE